MNKLIISIFTLLMVAVGAVAQTATVTGTVTDDYGPVIGATVIVQGTTIGCTTDLDGKFSLANVPNVDKAVLKISFVGMEEVKEPLKGRTSGINIHMTESASMLEDVVVIGYGTQKRGNLTGSISSVSGKILEKVQTTSAAEAIVGKLPGVQVTTVDGSPDAEVKILVRGGGSITQDNSPLIILDGFEVSSLNDVPPTDIESIEVLKDAASTAIYGARGANGVILVSTKNPTEGRVSISLNTYIQTKTLSNKLDVMDPYEFVLMQYENARQKSSNPTDFNNKYGHAYEHYIYQGDPGTDWQDEVFGTHPVASYLDLSVNGGTEKAKYKLAFIHQDQPSVMVGNGLKQNNLNASFNFKPFKFLTMEYRTRLLHKEVDGSGTEGVSLLDALRQAPTEGLDEYMTLPEDDTYFDPDQLEEIVRFNPKEESEKNYKKRINKSLNTMGALTWDIAKGLTLRNEFGFENNTEEQRKFWGMGTKNAKNNNNQPMAEWMMKQGTKWQLTNVLNYNFTLDDDAHDIRLMLGQEIKNQQTTTKTYSTRYFPENTTAEKAFDNLSLGTPYENSSKADSPSRISSFFGRINYGYKDKYLATFTLRADGSSSFAKESRWGWFPSVALAWKVNNEAFLKDVEAINSLKLRLGWGVVGNQWAGSYAYGVTMASAASIWGTGFYAGNYPNRELKWEETNSFNVGLDLALFNNRIEFIADAYYKKTDNLLMQASLPTYVSGLIRAPWVNAGAMTNKGVEFTLNTHNIQTRDFTWTSGLTFSINHNEVTKLYSESSAISGINGSETLTYTMVGEPVGQFYGYKVIGMFKEEGDFYKKGADGNFLLDETGNRIQVAIPKDQTIGKSGIWVGDYIYEDRDNNGVIDEKDRTFLGNPAPKFTFGFNNYLSYKGFDLNIFLNGSVGNKAINLIRRTFTDPMRNSNLLKEATGIAQIAMHDPEVGDEVLSNVYVANADAAKVQRITTSSANDNNRISDRFVEDASYLRIKNISLGYTFPQKWLRRLQIDHLRLYVNIQNLCTITGYKGYDPEIGALNYNVLLRGVDDARYPSQRIYTFGLNFNF